MSGCRKGLLLRGLGLAAGLEAEAGLPAGDALAGLLGAFLMLERSSLALEGLQACASHQQLLALGGGIPGQPAFAVSRARVQHAARLIR